MTSYQEQVITSLLQVQRNALPSGAQSITVDLKTDDLQQVKEAIQSILEEYPTESLDAIFSLFPEKVQSTTQNVDNINNEVDVTPDLSSNTLLQMQQELLGIRSEFEERLTSFESKLRGFRLWSSRLIWMEKPIRSIAFTPMSRGSTVS